LVDFQTPRVELDDPDPHAYTLALRPEYDTGYGAISMTLEPVAGGVDEFDQLLPPSVLYFIDGELPFA
jgi:hypothetical protein